MQPIVRVFVSSTWLDLQPERLAVEKALQRMHQTKLNGMEYFGSRDETTRDVSLKEVDRSDVYVGIIGGRYGSGITKEEYQRASEKPLPRFIYFKDEQTIQAESRDPEKENQEKLTTWKEELRQTHALGTGPFTSPDDLAARVTADLSNWLLDRYGAQLYIDGVGSLPFDYAGRIENFLGEYLGTAKSPVPFGGREKDLKALDAWLDDPAAPSYFMMAAPAGRGKSALLVRWTRQVLARANIALVFVPISIRFRTNLSGVTFAALAARLARLHGEKIPDTPSAETWRGLVTEYLRRPLPSGEKLLVVLDGLDEAADWEAGPDLFPLPPPDHVRVVVSARYRAGDEDARDWLRRLGWERQDLAKSYDLDKLTKEGVALVLESMGFPLAQLGAQIDLVAELYRLSEGDPLLVRLYVDDLWTHREMVGSLKPEDLRTLQPGLKGYFDRWWADQRTLWGKESPLKELNVQALMDVLACALGPLDQEALLRLTRLTSSWDLVEALKPLDRFIAGDGKVHGYVFSHPRLGDYFKQELSHTEQEKWEKEFLAWGQETMQALEQGALASNEAPAYVVQYYGAHLEQAHASAETMLTLVCQGWSKAWEALEGSFAGFLNDVERAWRAAERENEQAIANGQIAPRIGDEIRCALVRASINSFVANLPVKLILQLVKYKRWSFQQAIVYARQIPEIDRRAEALLRLVTELTMPDNLRDQSIVETLAAIQAIEDIGNRQEFLLALAPINPIAVLAAARAIKAPWAHAKKVLIALLAHVPERDRTALLDEALSAARVYEDLTLHVRVLIARLPHVPERDRTVLLDEALTTARAIKDEWERGEVLEVLAPYRPEVTLTAAHDINDSWPRARVLIALMPHVPEQDRTALLDEALSAARVHEAPWLCARVLSDLLPRVPERNRTAVVNEALTVARVIEDGEERAEKLAALLPHMPKRDRTAVVDEVLTVVPAIKNRRKRAEILAVLVPHTTEHARLLLLEEALALVRRIGGSTTEYLLPILPALAPYQPEAVLAAARAIECPWGHHDTLMPLAAHLLQDRHADQDWHRYAMDVLIALAPYRPEAVLTAARAIADPRYRAEILAVLLPHVPERERMAVVDEALTATCTIVNFGLGLRAELLKVLAPYRPGAVLTAARAIEDPWFFSKKVFIALLPHMPERERTVLLEEALSVACAVKDDGERAEMLAALLPHVPELDRTALLDEALIATRADKSGWKRREVLQALAPYRPEAVLAAARAIEDRVERVETLAALLPLVPKQDRMALLDEAFTVARAIEHPSEIVLIALLPHVTELDRTALLEKILTAAQAIGYKGDRAITLRNLVRHRRLFSQTRFYPFWRSLLHHCSTLIREELMSDLSALVPVIADLGKARALEGMFHAVHDVTTWWP